MTMLSVLEERFYNPYLNDDTRHAYYAKMSREASPVEELVLGAGKLPVMRNDSFDVDRKSPRTDFIRYANQSRKSSLGSHFLPIPNQQHHQLHQHHPRVVVQQRSNLNRVQSIDTDHSPSFVRYARSRSRSTFHSSENLIGQATRTMEYLSETNRGRKPDEKPLKMLILRFSRDQFSTRDFANSGTLYDMHGRGEFTASAALADSPKTVSNQFGYAYHLPSRTLFATGYSGQAMTGTYMMRWNGPHKAGPKLRVGRYFHAALFVDDRLYVTGGVDVRGNELLNDMEFLLMKDVAAGKERLGWILEEPMPIRVCGHAMEPINSGFVMIGGQVKRNTLVASVYAYNVITGVWTLFPNLNEPRAFFQSCTYESKIFVAGGINCRSLEEYDPKRDTWRCLHDLPKEVSHGLMLASHGHLYLFTQQQEMLVYNMQSDSWLVVDQAKSAMSKSKDLLFLAVSEEMSQ